MSGPVEVLAVLDAEIACKRIAVANGYSSEEVLNETEETRDAVAELIDCHRALYRHYVNTLESARDRIIELGGDCDPVDRMEQSDPVLARSRAALAGVGGAK